MAAPAHQEMGRFGDLVIALAVTGNLGALVGAVRLRVGLEQPEGHVYAGDLFDAVLVHKALGQQLLSLAVVAQGFLGLLLALLEGDHAVGPVRAGKHLGHDGGVAAVNAFGGGHGFIGNDLRAAGLAPVGTQVGGFFLGIPAASGVLPLQLIVCGVFHLHAFQLLDGVQREGIAAGRAFQLLALAAKGQGRAASGAFIVASGLRHRESPFHKLSNLFDYSFPSYCLHKVYLETAVCTASGQAKDSRSRI